MRAMSGTVSVGPLDALLLTIMKFGVAAIDMSRIFLLFPTHWWTSPLCSGLCLVTRTTYKKSVLMTSDQGSVVLNLLLFVGPLRVAPALFVTPDSTSFISPFQYASPKSVP